MILIIIYSKPSLIYTLIMKRLFFFIFILPLFFSCKNLAPEYYVQLSIVENTDIVFHPATPVEESHFETIQNVIFNCRYHLAPLDINKDIGNVEVYSTDPDVIEILSVDTEHYNITAKTKNKGIAKVKVVTEKYYSSTSLYILVQ